VTMATKPWKNLRDKLYEDPERRARIEAGARAMIDAARLAEVRESRSVRQVDLAAALKVTQSNVSRIESQDDHYLSTLANYVESLGGKLSVVIEFPDQTINLVLPDRKTA
jgi:DNA-binding Xre family transcriptional regulator